ncbi:MAG: tRNA (adenosine(37)-N6)-threonylcarbamoyltransferase complex ATPase subunit type 1 TsaE [Pirellulales bacterium]|nr:tRNA (adenosine(37)-N6)-threonylcarbamoyltransferase complex ATPase subunit type 1 TsaE [Pirellulales bacterium]
MIQPFVFQASSEADTAQLGAALAAALPAQSIIGLSGTLGSGKTRLVQAIASACGIDVQSVVSPTYVIVHEYHAATSIFHFDLYRLADEDEYFELGPEEYFERPGFSLLEWSDRFEHCLPPDRLDIAIAITDEQQRCFQITAHSETYAPTLDYLRKQFP